MEKIDPGVAAEREKLNRKKISLKQAQDVLFEIPGRLPVSHGGGYSERPPAASSDDERAISPTV